MEIDSTVVASGFKLATSVVMAGLLMGWAAPVLSRAEEEDYDIPENKTIHGELLLAMMPYVCHAIFSLIASILGLVAGNKKGASTNLLIACTAVTGFSTIAGALFGIKLSGDLILFRDWERNSIYMSSPMLVGYTILVYLSAFCGGAVLQFMTNKISWMVSMPAPLEFDNPLCNRAGGNRPEVV